MNSTLATVKTAREIGQLQIVLHAVRQGQAACADNHWRARHALEPVDALAQVGGCAGGIVVGPQQRGKGLARLRPVQRQSGQQGGVAGRQSLRRQLLDAAQLRRP
jgi:hypothetical protein